MKMDKYFINPWQDFERKYELWVFGMCPIPLYYPSDEIQRLQFCSRAFHLDVNIALKFVTTASKNSKYCNLIDLEPNKTDGWAVVHVPTFHLVKQ